MGRMPFLPPNQQCQSTEGSDINKARKSHGQVQGIYCTADGLILLAKAAIRISAGLINFNLILFSLQFCLYEFTRTHTHMFNCPFSGTTQVSLYWKDKTNLDFTEARDSEW